MKAKKKNKGFFFFLLSDDLTPHVELKPREEGVRKVKGEQAGVHKHAPLPHAENLQAARAESQSEFLLPDITPLSM